MSQTYYTILTKLGAELLANATVLGVPLKLTSMAVGDGNGSIPKPIATQTALINEVRRAAINVLSVDKNNPNQIIAEQVIPETEGGWFIHEVGLYDDKDNLIAVGNCPSTYKPRLAEGSGRTQVIRMIIIVDNVDSVAIKIDPSVVLATREYVDVSTNKLVPCIRKINNKSLKQDIELNANDINALPATWKESSDKANYEVKEAVNFMKRPKHNNIDLVSLSDFTKEFAKNGYQKLPNGLIIQWLEGNNSVSTSGKVTLPIAFPNEVLYALFTDTLYTLDGAQKSSIGAGCWGKGNSSKSQLAYMFTIIPGAFNVLAIGY